MINIKTFKKILSDNGLGNLSESEIIYLRDNQDKMAEIFFNMWVNEIKSKGTEV